MERYIWQFNGQPQEITLKRRTANGYTFEYPANSAVAGSDWRMSDATFDHYTKIGAIVIVGGFGEGTDFPAHMALDS